MTLEANRVAHFNIEVKVRDKSIHIFEEIEHMKKKVLQFNQKYTSKTNISFD